MTCTIWKRWSCENCAQKPKCSFKLHDKELVFKEAAIRAPKTSFKGMSCNCDSLSLCETSYNLSSSTWNVDGYCSVDNDDLQTWNKKLTSLLQDCPVESFDDRRNRNERRISSRKELWIVGADCISNHHRARRRR